MHFYLDLKGNLPKIKLWEFFYGEEEGLRRQQDYSRLDPEHVYTPASTSAHSSTMVSCPYRI